MPNSDYFLINKYSVYIHVNILSRLVSTCLYKHDKQEIIMNLYEILEKKKAKSITEIQTKNLLLFYRIHCVITFPW